MSNSDLALPDDLAQALVRFIDSRIESRLKVANADDLVEHKRIPVPTRVSCEACVAGEVAEARKVGRRWIAPRSSWDAWLDRRAKQTAPSDVLTRIDALVEKRAKG